MTLLALKHTVFEIMDL